MWFYVRACKQNNAMRTKKLFLCISLLKVVFVRSHYQLLSIVWLCGCYTHFSLAMSQIARMLPNICWIEMKNTREKDTLSHSQSLRANKNRDFFEEFLESSKMDFIDDCSLFLFSIQRNKSIATLKRQCKTDWKINK